MRQDARARDHRRHIRIGNARLALVVSAGVLAWAVLRHPALSLWTLLVPACVFGLLALLHGRVLGRLERSRKAVAFYDRALARMEGRWGEAGEPGDGYGDDAHPYAQDLDLFGRGSLFQLLSSAQTRGGERALASWLKTPAPPGEILARQEAVRELAPGLDLREDMALLGADAGPALHPDLLLAWAGAPPRLLPGPLRVLAPALAALTVASLAWWGVRGEHLWFSLMLLAELGLVYALRRTVRPVIREAEDSCRDLGVLSRLLGRLEREEFRAERLRRLRAPLERGGAPASAVIARLDRLVVLVDSRRNQLFAPFAFILLWDIQLAGRIEDWRRRHGASVPGWLDAVSELEALSSLAGYAYEHPGDPFPELCEHTPCFEGEGVGHPLLDPARSVPNDVSLGAETRVLLVSGSNMSGKSTLLRTVGVNAVLALAGAPVRARRLRISPLALGASIRVHDSLQEGASRFYAEIKRLEKLVRLAGGSPPLLFLLDELLGGTNSHDRRIGAEAIVKGLTDRGAIGLVTTHDLALARIAENMAPRAANVHFEDRIVDGRMTFDYDLKPGVISRSNALELMRSIGLEV
ncbi:MAG: DNA mismatch repair protein MutS [Acidobacteria bacterium]|nr:DNA mismatch repair protein MutS [Acidobacteriota bacterium]